MSLEGVEKALYDLNLSRRSREAFGEAPDTFMSRYVLSEPQRQMLQGRDVRSLIELGANPMLVWGFWMTCSEDRSNSTYLARLRAEPAGDDVESR